MRVRSPCGRMLIDVRLIVLGVSIVWLRRSAAAHAVTAGDERLNEGTGQNTKKPRKVAWP